MSRSRYCLHIALGLTLLLGSVDMSLNMYYFTEGEKYILYFSLVDAVVFTILTIVLVICTVQLFNFLKVLRHTSKKERLLMVLGASTSLRKPSSTLQMPVVVSSTKTSHGSCTCFLFSTSSQSSRSSHLILSDLSVTPVSAKRSREKTR